MVRHVHERHERLASDEVLDIMQLIAKEGRTARNVVSWSVNPNLSESDAVSVQSGLSFGDAVDPDGTGHEICAAPFDCRFVHGIMLRI